MLLMSNSFLKEIRCKRNLGGISRRDNAGASSGRK
jgi:hypothetical protein